MIDKKIIFAMPSAKKVVSEYYKAGKEVFLHLSVTADQCELMCGHCKAYLLKKMLPVMDGAALQRALLARNISGCLLSGGFDKQGRIDFTPFYGAIRHCKVQRPDLKIYLHAGFVTLQEAMQIKDCLADAVLVNAIGSRKIIEDVYNLKEYGPQDYMESIFHLQKASVKVVPHIIAGLEDGKIKSEKQMIQALLERGINNLVLAALKRLSKKAGFTSSCFHPGAFIDLIHYAKRIDPRCTLSIGCARPPYLRKHDVELQMIQAGADILSFPSEDTLRFYHENNLAYELIETCCSPTEIKDSS